MRKARACRMPARRVHLKETVRTQRQRICIFLHLGLTISKAFRNRSSKVEQCFVCIRSSLGRLCMMLDQQGSKFQSSMHWTGAWSSMDTRNLPDKVCSILVHRSTKNQQDMATCLEHRMDSNSLVGTACRKVGCSHLDNSRVCLRN